MEDHYIAAALARRRGGHVQAMEVESDADDSDDAKERCPLAEALLEMFACCLAN